MKKNENGHMERTNVLDVINIDKYDTIRQHKGTFRHTSKSPK